MSGGTLGELVKVSIGKHAEGVRLRWRISGKRPEIYIPESLPNYQLTAERLKKVIEDDCLLGKYDPTLNRYRQMLKYSLVPEVQVFRKLSFPELFDQYMGAKSKNIDNLPRYYSEAKRLLTLWGNVTLDQIPVLLGKYGYSPRSFNDRRNCLSKFFQYLVKKKLIPENPLDEVSNQTPDDYVETRVPFTPDEVTRILNAIRTDQFRKGRYPHSQYYPLVAFMIQTGVRNGEAIALQVRDLIWEDEEVRICRSLARAGKGTHMKVRKEKGTKNSNIRFIPMNAFLVQLLRPLCEHKAPKDLVFINSNGNMIDDRAFQRRVFKPILRKLGIPVRDLYACRHTFATRAVQAGMKPHEVAYLMGDSLETVVNTYFHKEKVKTVLPDMIKKAL